MSAGAGESGLRAAVRYAGRAAAALKEKCLLFPLAKLCFVLAFKEKIVWAEKNADLPYPGKHRENQGHEENRPNGIKLESVF